MVRATLTGWTLGDAILDHEHEIAGWLTCTAVDGTVTASSVRSVRAAVHQRAGPQQLVLVRHGGAHIAMPVAASTVFSIIATLADGALRLAGDDAPRRSRVLRNRLRRYPAGATCGTVKVT